MSEILDFLVINQRHALWALTVITLGLSWIAEKKMRQVLSSGRTTLPDGYRPLAITGTRLAAIGGVLSGLVIGWYALTDRPVVDMTAALVAPRIESGENHANVKLLVLVHGWNGDPGDTWRKFPALVQSDPSFSAFDLWSIDYPTFQLRRNLSIRQMARWLNETMVRNGYYDKYNEIFVIAHSMGGLIVRQMLIENRLRHENKAYRGLIEIATPHQGASLAGIISVLGLSRGFSDDLTPGSEMLRTLQDDWNSLTDRPRTYCLTSPQDMVVTQESAIAQCDEYLRYPSWGHIEMIKPEGASDDRYQVPTFRIRKGGWSTE